MATPNAAMAAASLRVSRRLTSACSGDCSFRSVIVPLLAVVALQSPAGGTIACLAGLPKSTIRPSLQSQSAGGAPAPRRPGPGSALLAPQLLLEFFQPSDQGVALASELGDLSVPEERPLLLLRDLRLKLRLALVEIFQLSLEARDALTGRQIADEEHVEDE